MKKSQMFVLITAISLLTTGLLGSCKKSADTAVVPKAVDSLKVGLVAYYPFDNSGVDVSGNGNHGFVNNITSATDHNGIANGAYHFDGVSSYISVKDNPALRLSGTDYTINVWQKLDSYGTTYGSIIVCKRGSGSTNGWNYGIHGYTSSNNSVLGQTTMQISGGNDATATGVKVIELNKWYMLTTVYNVKKLQISYYVNGILDNVINNIPSPSTTASSDMFIGSDNPLVSGTLGYFFKGTLDDISIYNRALSVAEIQKLYMLTSFDL